jgi:hypothetical protein
MGFPVGLAVWSAVGGLAAYRALVRPVRAVFDQGEITACPGGPSCATGLAIRSTRGVSPVYALVSGTVTRVLPDRVDLVSAHEPVLLSYQGALSPTLTPGQPVRAGDVIGQAASVSLTVAQIQRLAGGALALTLLEPASWLATRGLRAATKQIPGALWCQGGRTLTIPQDVARCGMRLPDPSGFSLLPVSARLTT